MDMPFSTVPLKMIGVPSFFYFFEKSNWNVFCSRRFLKIHINSSISGILPCSTLYQNPIAGINDMLIQKLHISRVIFALHQTIQNSARTKKRNFFYSYRKRESKTLLLCVLIRKQKKNSIHWAKDKLKKKQMMSASEKIRSHFLSS